MTAVVYVTKVVTAWVMAAVKWFQNLILYQKAWKMWKNRELCLSDKECVKEALKEVQRLLFCQTQVRMLDDSGIISRGFSDTLIDKIVSNVNFIYNVHDVIEHCNPPTLKVAVIILEIVKETFEDVIRWQVTGFQIIAGSSLLFF